MSKTATLDVEAPVQEAPRKPLTIGQQAATMTLDQLEELAITDPEKVQAILNIQRMIADRRKADEQIKQDARARLQLLESEIGAREQELAWQKTCGRNMHRRPDGIVAISGQRMGDHYFFICCRCSANFFGIGDGPNQLPRDLANHVDFNLMGG